MEFFKSFLRAVGLLEPCKVDLISELPLEVSQLILRKLDPESLLGVAQVSRKWLKICRSDNILRRSARHHQRRAMRRIREKFVGGACVEKKKVKVMKLRDTKKTSRVEMPRTFEAAVVFRRTQDPRGPQRRSVVKPSLDIRPVKTIRL